MLLTGATGSLGREVVTRLLARDVVVHALARTAGPQRPGAVWHVGDVADPEVVTAAAREVDTLASNARGWRAQLAAGDTISGPDVPRTSVVDPRDVAEAAVVVLLGEVDAWRARPLVLTGPEPLDRAGMVTALGAALGRPLRFAPVAVEQARAAMLAGGRPPALAEAPLAATARPPSELVSDDVRRLTGHAPRSFAAWCADHAAELG